MTKNRSMKLAVLVLALALITSCFVGSTFAKFTSTATGSASATVAEWSFMVEDTEIVATPAVTSLAFDLTETRYDSDRTSEEDDVRDDLIAPGTSGAFTIKLENTSDVTVNYDITLTPNLNGVPIKFSTTGADDSYGDIDAAFNAAIDGSLAIDAAAKTVTIYWEWAYGESVDDNAHSGKALTIAVSVVATQAD